jgi:hypothetical protein
VLIQKRISREAREFNGKHAKARLLEILDAAPVSREFL